MLYLFDILIKEEIFMRHKNNKIEIGEKLKKARLSCGLTQEQVCEKINCAPRYIRTTRNK